MKRVCQWIWEWSKGAYKCLIKFFSAIWCAQSKNRFAGYQHLVHFTAIALLLFIILGVAWVRWSTFIATVAPSSDIFGLCGLVEYNIFTWLCGIFIFIGVLYIIYLSYLDEQAKSLHYPYGAMAFISRFCMGAIGAVWCLSIYYGYACLTPVNIIYSFKSLTGILLIIIVSLVLVCLLFICKTSNIYGKVYPVLVVVRVVVTLFFFNLAIAHIFEVLLQFNITLFSATILQGAVSISAILTICYLCYLFTRKAGVAYLEDFEWYALAAITGFALGLQLSFYIITPEIYLISNAVDFFFTVFSRLLVVEALCAMLVFNVFLLCGFEHSYLNRGFNGAIIFAAFVYQGFALIIVLPMGMWGLSLPFGLSHYWLLVFFFICNLIICYVAFTFLYK